MDSPPIIDFRSPAEMTLKERRAEIVALLSRGLGRYVAERPAVPQTVQSDSEESSETSLNQLDALGTESLYAADENT
ncbi:MAG: hypothetical protein V2I43_09820 [Parvularcula sp.]|jgi:hypothetical protein|nr:hypothetical protein [Parvularcula sp.]